MIARMIFKLCEKTE